MGEGILGRIRGLMKKDGAPAGDQNEREVSPVEKATKLAKEALLLIINSEVQIADKTFHCRKAPTFNEIMAVKYDDPSSYFEADLDINSLFSQGNVVVVRYYTYWRQEFDYQPNSGTENSLYSYRILVKTDDGIASFHVLNGDNKKPLTSTAEAPLNLNFCQMITFPFRVYWNENDAKPLAEYNDGKIPGQLFDLWSGHPENGLNVIEHTGHFAQVLETVKGGTPETNKSERSRVSLLKQVFAGN